MSPVEPIYTPDPLLSACGVVLAQNNRHQPYDLTDLQKWLRLNAELFKAEKVEIIAEAPALAHMPSLLEHSRHFDLPLSLRTSAATPPPGLPDWAEKGLLSVCFTPATLDPGPIQRWADACAEAGLPFRVQLRGPWNGDALPIDGLVKALRGAAVVGLTPADPFDGAWTAANATQSAAAVEAINELATELAGVVTELNIYHLPFCHIDPDHLPKLRNMQQVCLDHQAYMPIAARLARMIHPLSAARMSKVVEMNLARQTSFHNLLDQALLPWIYNHPWVFLRMWMLHKLVRHTYWIRRRFRPLPQHHGPASAAADAAMRAEQKTIGPVCATCRFQRICSHASETFRQSFPGLGISAVPGEEVLDPLHYIREQSRFLDAVDQARLAAQQPDPELADHARRLTADVPPTREIAAESYGIEGLHTEHMPNSVRWHSYTPSELQSTVLCKVEPPFTIGFTVGGGFAHLVGFSFGRAAKVLCPMIRSYHRIVLHVDEHGRYVLLRDDEAIRPIELEEIHVLPRRLGGVLEPRISIWNIDGQILTQTVLLWEHDAPFATSPEHVRFSVVVVSSRYARRLQAVLLGIAHQQDIPLESIEVIVAYVPGLDATDDLIDSMRATHPNLRLLRSPFPKANARSKGFMINESAKMAAGEWVVLLDSDIVLPPDFFQQLSQTDPENNFVAPDGRKMLSPETTAAVLLGEVRPWENYDKLLESAGEYRHREAKGVPPGFCQCVRRSVLLDIPYVELDHFEASDWHFANSIIEKHGPEHRLENMQVLHLDHGGSQWYGTAKHM